MLCSRAAYAAIPVRGRPSPAWGCAIIGLLLLFGDARFAAAQETDRGEGRHLVRSHGVEGHADRHKKHKPEPSPTPSAGDPYWDIDGSNPGAGGTTPSGVWDTITPNWNVNGAGIGSANPWNNGDAAVFSAIGATGSYTVTVSGSISASTITFQTGTVTLAGTATPALTISNPGTGINIFSSVGGPVTFDSSLGDVLVSASQNWTNSSAQAFNVNSGVVASGGAVTLTLNGTSSGGTTISGVLGNGTGTLSLNVNNTGTGITTLTGANTYTGATTVSAGVLDIQNNTALGTTAGGVSVTSGAALQLEGGIAVGAEALALNGTGISSGGALRNVAGDNSYAGVITLGSASRINSDAGTLTIDSAGSITGATFGLTVGGAGNVTINDPIATTSGTLTKDGAGTLTLGQANTYTGTTTISAGDVKVQNNTSLGTTANGTTVASGAAILIDGSGLNIAEAISLIGDGGGTGALENLANNNTWSGAITLGAGGARINSDGGTLTLSGGITGGGNALTIGGAGNVTVSTNAISGTGTTLTKDGAGTLTLSAANSFTGATNINAGILNIQNNTALGTVAGGVTVADGATLQLQGTITVGAEALTLNGNGAAGQNGSLVNVANANTYGGLVTLGEDSTISSDGGTLSLTNAGTITGSGFDLTLTGGGHGNLTSIIGTGAGTLTKSGAGTLDAEWGEHLHRPNDGYGRHSDRRRHQCARQRRRDRERGHGHFQFGGKPQ